MFRSATHFLPETVSPGRVNVNTAPAEELAVLPGIGETRAHAIVAWREENGCFSGPEDLMQVHGIGPKILENIMDMTKYN
ncbi:MAG: ComEA family DNA-binding protein [Ruminococcaceae bacterium]|nr:ComEA family DNA-binding protein [Oscillospiraceae bacterium]